MTYVLKCKNNTLPSNHIIPVTIAARYVIKWGTKMAPVAVRPVVKPVSATENDTGLVPYFTAPRAATV